MRSSRSSNSSSQIATASNRRSERSSAVVVPTSHQKKDSFKRGSGLKRPPSVVIDETSSEDEDNSDTGNSLITGRQKRLRTVDISKEILILRPKDDVEEVLGLTETEAEDFAEFLETTDDIYLYEGREVKDEPSQMRSSMVHTPRVVAASSKVPPPSLEKIALFFKKQKELAKELIPKPIVMPVLPFPLPDPNAPRGRGRPRIYPINTVSPAMMAAAQAAAKAAAAAQAKLNKTRVNFGERVNRTSYTVYDADHEDEQFLNCINNEKGVSRAQFIALEEFEEMMAALERALENSKETLPSMSKLMDLKKLCTSFIVESNGVASFVGNSLAGVKDINKGSIKFEPSADLLRADGDKFTFAAAPHASSTTVAAATATATATATNGAANGNSNGNSEALRTYTKEELRQLVPEDRAVHIMGVIISEFSKPPNNTPKPNKKSIPVVLTPAARSRAVRVYNHWLEKRANKACSFIRCYHNFIMDMWKRQDIVPKIPDDANEKLWLQSRQQLLRIRVDLDRARLIMDRVRRREKLKRELNIAAIDAFDDFIGSPEEENGPKPLPFSIEYVDPKETSGARDTLFTNSFISSRTVEDNFGSDVLNSSHISGAGWTPLEDKLLLLGVAAYGIGSWSKIRDLFNTNKTSIYMNQRFQRLTRQRQIKYGNNADKMSRDTSITKLGVPAVIVGNDSGLSANLQRFVNSFTEESIWDGIAVRHVLESHNPEKRCGRPSKSPVRIPVPKSINVLDMRSLMEKGFTYVYDPKRMYEVTGELVSGRGSRETSQNGSVDNVFSLRSRGRPPQAAVESRRRKCDEESDEEDEEAHTTSKKKKSKKDEVDQVTGHGVSRCSLSSLPSKSATATLKGSVKKGSHHPRHSNSHEDTRKRKSTRVK